MEDLRKALVEKLKTLSPERFEAVCWLLEHWTILKAIVAGEPLNEEVCLEEMGRAAREGDGRLQVLIALYQVWQKPQKTCRNISAIIKEKKAGGDSGCAGKNSGYARKMAEVAAVYADFFARGGLTAVGVRHGAGRPEPGRSVDRV